jgi:hypothetical protein
MSKDATNAAEDTTDADLLEAFLNDHPTSANLEQDCPVEGQTLAPAASVDPVPAPPRYPTPPEADSLHAAPEIFIEHFPDGSPGAPLPGPHQGSSIYHLS